MPRSEHSKFSSGRHHNLWGSEWTSGWSDTRNFDRLYSSVGSIAVNQTGPRSPAESPPPSSSCLLPITSSGPRPESIPLLSFFVDDRRWHSLPHSLHTSSPTASWLSEAMAASGFYASPCPATQLISLRNLMIKIQRTVTSMITPPSLSLSHFTLRPLPSHVPRFPFFFASITPPVGRAPLDDYYYFDHNGHRHRKIFRIPDSSPLFGRIHAFLRLSSLVAADRTCSLIEQLDTRVQSLRIHRCPMPVD